MFEATAANFQQLVLERKVPVLVDIYADWCGPCKQLGPMLESAAMKSGKSMHFSTICSTAAHKQLLHSLSLFHRRNVPSC